MTKHDVKTAVSRIKELLGEDEDFLREGLRGFLQEVLESEMTAAVGAAKGERVDTRLGYRSGYYERTLVTRVGRLELRVPQDRDGRFSTSVFERYQRSEKALVAALSEMYVQGVSTRKVKRITEELCGHSFSASTISNIVKRLDGQLAAFARRRLEELYLSTAAGICTGAAARKCTTGSVVACPRSPWEGPARGATRPPRGWRRPARGRGLWAHAGKRGVIRTVAGVVTGSA